MASNQFNIVQGASIRDTGKNNRFPFLDILGYLKNTHKNPNQGTWLGIPWLGLVSLC